MGILTLTSKGRVTLGRDVLRHLGVKSGDKISIDLLPDGRAVLTPVRAQDCVERLFGLLYDPDQRPLSIEEINDIIADGWARQ